MTYFGLAAMAAAEKAEMRDLALRGGPFSGTERDALLDYCAADVTATARLLERMQPHLDWPRALLRGRQARRSRAMKNPSSPPASDSMPGSVRTHPDA